MAEDPAAVRGIVARACARPDAPGGRADRDCGTVISALSAVGGPWAW